MIDLGRIPSWQRVDSQEKREKRIPPQLQNATELKVKNPAAEITLESIDLIKKSFDMTPPVRITVDGEEVHNDALTPNKRYNFDFADKIEIWSNNVSLLHIELHGNRIAPQGAVANERKLIFAVDRASL